MGEPPWLSSSGVSSLQLFAPAMPSATAPAPARRASAVYVPLDVSPLEAAGVATAATRQLSATVVAAAGDGRSAPVTIAELLARGHAAVSRRRPGRVPLAPSDLSAIEVRPFATLGGRLAPRYGKTAPTPPRAWRRIKTAVSGTHLRPPCCTISNRRAPGARWSGTNWWGSTRDWPAPAVRLRTLATATGPVGSAPRLATALSPTHTPQPEAGRLRLALRPSATRGDTGGRAGTRRGGNAGNSTRFGGVPRSFAFRSMLCGTLVLWVVAGPGSGGARTP